MLNLMLAPAAACMLIAGIHCYFGLHVVARGVIFVDLAIAQIAVLGSVAALSLGFSEGWPSDLAALACVFAAAGIFAGGPKALTGHRQGVPQEALIGITYAVAAAATILLLDHNPHGHDLLKQAVAGSVLFATWSDVAKMAGVYGAVGALHFAFRKRFAELSNDDEGAHAQIRHFKFWDFLFYATFGLVVVVSVHTAGVLLVFTYLVVPASAAMFFFRGARNRLLFGWALGLAISLLGLLASASFDLPTGAVIVVVGGAAFAAAVVAAKVQRCVVT